MRYVALKIAYIGNIFYGSQIQPGKRTVEGDILSDLDKIGQHDPDLRMAGRTDRGVNAIGNVASLRTDFPDNGKLLSALNAVSSDVFYLAAADVDETFNPRHAEERTYRYVLNADELDVRLVKECAELFVGEHDFTNFCKMDDRSPVVNMISVTITESGNTIVIEFTADHFLWNMIRRIVAAIESVAKGKATKDDVKDALNGKAISFGLARPDALTLCDIVYDGVQFKRYDTFEKRLDERSFSISLEKMFYDSLK